MSVNDSIVLCKKCGKMMFSPATGEWHILGEYLIKEIKDREIPTDRSKICPYCEIADEELAKAVYERRQSIWS